MSETTKITSEHLRRSALVYVRQSSAAQVEANRESTQRQYGLVERAVELGWNRADVDVVDQDLGISGSGLAERAGFAEMTAQVALGRVGIVLALEVSRLARNNSDWYRLLDLSGVTDTLIADADGIYHPAHFNDRLVLGLKGTMSEAELHVLRARLEGGIRSKASRGELRRGLPVGLIWGDDDGDVRFHPDEAVTGAVRCVFERFAELGSVRRVWLWFGSEGLTFPLQSSTVDGIRWVTPSYHTIYQVLTNPVYAGAYVYGKTHQERYVDDSGQVRKRVRRLPRSEWAVLIRDHHEGFIDWETFEQNEARIAANQRPRPHANGDGPVREGAALLQGLATCGHCGRALRVYYSGRNSTPGYFCAGSHLTNGRAERCVSVGGQQIERAVAAAFLDSLAPAGLESSLAAAEQLEGEYDAALAQWRREVERLHYQAQRAERRYRAVDPDNRLVARGLEAEWETSLRELQAARTELQGRKSTRPRALAADERQARLALGTDLERVWCAPAISDRDRKELLHTLLEEVIITVDRRAAQAHLTLRWVGGLLSDLQVPLRGPRHAPIRTDEDTMDLVRRLAVHYSDALIAGLLNRQGRRTATGLRFTANRVNNLRNHWGIPRCQASSQGAEGELLTVQETANQLDVAASTVHRWLNDGFIRGEQLTPGAPWRIRMTDELRARFVEETPQGYVPMIDATRKLGVSRQTVLQRVKRGELEAVHVCRGRRKGLRIKVPQAHSSLFEPQPSD